MKRTALKYKISTLHRLFLAIILIQPVLSYAKSAEKYFCFQASSKTLFLIGENYSYQPELMYYPYLKPLKIKFKYYESEETMPSRPFEFYDYFDEINHGKVTGQYQIMHQGAQFYTVKYTNLKSRKEIEFERLYNHGEKKFQQLEKQGVECF